MDDDCAPGAEWNKAPIRSDVIGLTAAQLGTGLALSLIEHLHLSIVNRKSYIHVHYDCSTGRICCYTRK